MIGIQDILALPNAEFLNLNFKGAKSVSTDSRVVSAGQVFFALRGEKFDGHNFVSDAVKRGASCAVVDRKWLRRNKRLAGILPLVAVDDTTAALGDLARIYRRKFGMPVIAVGGSNGKTTTKEMIAKVLGRKFRVAKTLGNHNNQVGVPQTIFGFKKSHDVAVVEIGTNHFGEIERLCRILEPDAGLITNIGSEHLEFFKSISGVRREEGKLFEFLRSTRGIAFTNVDDKNLADMSKKMRLKFTYGFQNRSHRNLRARLFGFDRRGCALFEMEYNGRTELVHLNVPGIHNAINALAAAAVGFHFGIDGANIKRALDRYRSYEKRMQIMKVGGVTILNDTYNSNPDSAIEALKWLSMVRASGRRIAVLADMLELGDSSGREHQRIGKQAAKGGVDFLFTFGKMALEIAAGAGSSAAGDGLETESFDKKEKLSGRLARMVSAGDVVLVKGSRGMKMEEIVNALQNELRMGGVR
ncbi:MAG: UDP-N-acetylmuramoyl-tripeptide--D-alanyl-D-alanine ligase [Bacteroidetes bacterium]|nr:UDP-N-acetylmuramoyl-tripeptide--D-alanyl-D-alanine ligase [Bacteroidota bacterium]